jgi:hypothetical protein
VLADAVLAALRGERDQETTVLVAKGEWCPGSGIQQRIVVLADAVLAALTGGRSQSHLFSFGV